jgi:hypothetical protein
MKLAGELPNVGSQDENMRISVLCLSPSLAGACRAVMLSLNQYSNYVIIPSDESTNHPASTKSWP